MTLTILEALAASKKSDTDKLQPEGREIALAYANGELQDSAENIYLIAWLLHELNVIKRDLEDLYKALQNRP